MGSGGGGVGMWRNVSGGWGDDVEEGVPVCGGGGDGWEYVEENCDNLEECGGGGWVRVESCGGVRKSG